MQNPVINDNLRFTSAPPSDNDRRFELGSYDDRDDHVFVNVCCDHVLLFFWRGKGGGGGVFFRVDVAPLLYFWTLIFVHHSLLILCKYRVDDNTPPDPRGWRGRGVVGGTSSERRARNL